MKSILIIEDDLTFSHLLKVWFTKKNYIVRTTTNFSDAKKRIFEELPEVVICDLRLPKVNGITILEWIKSKYPDIVVIMMTGYADIQSAVTSIKLGAYDYISKPFNPEELFDKINEASKQKTPQKESKKKEKITDKISTVNESNFEKNYIKGSSKAYQQLYDFVDLVAPTNLIVLIRGESGVGKEHVARMIHEKSKYASGPFVTVDCGVISKELAASDFFGHIKGAFTGAIDNKTGYFMSANKGTLFLDEIGNLPVNIQVQLLRVLQENKFKQVGSEKEIEVDIRIITATNEDVDFAVNNGYFRGDLYHRISEFIIDVPSLRDSKNDIQLYLRHFLKVSNSVLKKNILDYTPEALDILTEYEWPGNIRELKNIVCRLTLIATGDYITKEIIPDHFRSKLSKKIALPINEEEKLRIENALRISINNIPKAASILGIDTKTLFVKLKLYDLLNG
ncbi:MAG TPA: sigma-54 dependent transcriptional regulator [Paludibacter sp.]|nr:sigma-54 dependent transcriptional regulator [Paludibacter sp.]